MEKFRPVDAILTLKYFRNNIFGNSQYSEDSVHNPDKKDFLKAFREFKKSSVNEIDYRTKDASYFADYETYEERINGIVTLTIHTYTDIVENNLFKTEKMSVEKVKDVFLKAIAENTKDENTIESEEAIA